MVAKTVHGKYSYDPLALNDPGLNATIYAEDLVFNDPYKALFADISSIIDQLGYRLELVKDSFLLDK